MKLKKIINIGLFVVASVIAFSSNAEQASENAVSQNVTISDTSQGNQSSKKPGHSGRYRLNVVNGTGDGSYREGQKVRVRANNRNGYRFIQWRVTRGNPRIRDKYDRDTLIKMDYRNVEIKAVYKRRNNNNCDSWDDNCDDWDDSGDDWDDNCDGWDDECHDDWDDCNGWNCDDDDDWIVIIG